MNNSSYKKDRPQLTEEQILKNKDFNATLKNVNPTGNTYLKSIKYWGAGGVATIVIIASIFLLNNNSNIQNDTPKGEFTYQPSDGAIAQITSIKPPFAKHDIDYEVFEIDCNKDEVITSKSGTQFTVPKNSLIDAEGNPITGKAEIHYRELRNPVDFFLSGIPMDYDSAGTTYTFESAGMLDIKAFQNEVPLQLANNKTIDFEFNSTTEDDGYNFYSLNEATGVWTNENQHIEVAKTDETVTDQDNPKQIAINHQVTKSDLIKPIKQNKVKYSLNIAVNKDNYPELEKYEGTIFEINETNEKFDPIIYKIQWEGAELSDSKVKDNYTLKLTREDSSIYLTVYPVVNDEYYEQAIKQYRKDKTAYASNNTQDDFDAYTSYQSVSAQNEVGMAVIRTFTIAGFGIYNCDVPRMQPRILAKKKVVDSDSNPINFASYYVANPKKNSVVSLYNNPNKGKVKYYKNGATIVWFIDGNGMISIINPEQFANIKDIKYLQFDSFPPSQGIEVLRNLMAYK